MRLFLLFVSILCYPGVLLLEKTHSFSLDLIFLRQMRPSHQPPKGPPLVVFYEPIFG